MLNSVQKSVLVTGIATVAMMAAQTAFAANGDGLAGGFLLGVEGLLDQAFSITMETARRLVGL